MSSTPARVLHCSSCSLAVNIACLCVFVYFWPCVILHIFPLSSYEQNCWPWEESECWLCECLFYQLAGMLSHETDQEFHLHILLPEIFYVPLRCISYLLVTVLLLFFTISTAHTRPCPETHF